MSILEKTKGIALKTTNYSESSLVVHIFTEAFGMQSYLINGAKKPKAKIAANLFQPLHTLDLVVYYKENNSLQRIKEAQQSPVLKHIPLDITKSSLSLFINEILYKVLREQSPDPFLFTFIQQAILWLDESTTNLSNFHLVFLTKLSRYLGFLPLRHTEISMPYFDLIDGVFTKNLPAHKYVLQEPHTSILVKLLETDFNNAACIRMSKEDRKYLLERLLEFYKLHTENFGAVNSLYILEELFR